MKPKELIQMLMKLNKVSYRELSRRTGKSVTAVVNNLDRDMRLETFLAFANKLGCDVIVRDFNHCGAEWRVGDGLRICESEYKRTGEGRKRVGGPDGGTEEGELPEDLQGELYGDEGQETSAGCFDDGLEAGGHDRSNEA